MVELFSFYVKFASKAAVSTLCLDHYVTDGRPIICLGSQIGDISIYYIDAVSKATGKMGPKLIVSFNFFERGVKKIVSESEDDNRSDDDDSLLDRHASQKPFI